MLMKKLNGSSQTPPLLLQVAEVQVKYRNKVFFAELTQINNSGDAEKVFRANWSNNMELVEEFYVHFLNRSTM